MAKKSSKAAAKNRRAPSRKGGCLGRLFVLALLVAALAGGYWYYDKGQLDLESVASKIKDVVQTGEEPQVALYFAHPQWTKLVVERRAMKPTSDVTEKVERLVRMLISGPGGEEALPVLPEGAKLRKVYLGPGGLAMIDFEPNLDELRSYGVGGELLSVFALIHTICENVEEIKSVQIMVGGEVRETMAGHVRISEPLTPRPDLVGDGGGQ